MNQPGPEPPRQGAVAFEVIPLGRRRRRRIDPGLVLVLLTMALVLAAVVRPWASGPPPSTAVVPRPSSARPAIVPPPAPSIDPAASTDPSSPPDQARLALLIHDLAGYSGGWGVGVGAAVGPPFQPTLTIPASGVATDQGWWAWIGVHPVTSHPQPGASTDPVAGLAIAQLCTGVPNLPTGAQVVAVTAPSGPLSDLQIQAWREVGFHDEPRDIEPVPGIRQMTAFQSGDVSYFQQLSGRAWPDGRYVLQVAGSSETTLTICLGQP